jgi:hypothetical protein
MSIGIALVVPDGIALSADTQLTWSRTIDKATAKATGKEVELAEPIAVPVGWSRMARKLFSVRVAEKHFAILTAGITHINSRSMFAVFRSAALNFKGQPSCAAVSKHFVKHLKSELAKQHQCKVSDLKQLPFSSSEFVLASYEDDDVGEAGNALRTKTTCRGVWGEGQAESHGYLAPRPGLNAVTALAVRAAAHGLQSSKLVMLPSGVRPTLQ